MEVNDPTRDVCVAIERSFDGLATSVKEQSATIELLLEKIVALEKDNKIIVERLNKIQDELYDLGDA